MGDQSVSKLQAGHVHDAVVIGGGIAGLQAAIQLGRYEHDAVVIDKGTGRSTLCRSYHNLLGWPDGIAGTELRERGRRHAERYGIRFRDGEVVGLSREPDGTFRVSLASSGEVVRAKTALIATGVQDAYPPLPGLEDCMGKSVYICPDCDGYESRGKRTLVLGSGEPGAQMALTLTYWKPELLYVNHDGKQPNAESMERLKQAGIAYRAEALAEVLHDEGKLRGVELRGGTVLEAEAAFIAFGGNRVRTELAKQAGALLHENRHVATDPRTKETSVKGLFAAGDIGLHAEQTSVAIGEGMLAAIWMHKAIIGAKAAEREPQLV